MIAVLAGIDVGNNNIKAVGDQGRTHFYHALHELRSDQIAALTTRSKQVVDGHNSEGIGGVFQVNDKYYVVGESAIKMGAGTPRMGENRYTPDYYGVLGAIALSRSIANPTGKGRETVIPLCTYTPKDDIYIDNIKSAITGEWEVSHLGKTMRIVIKKVLTADEPVSHYRNAIFYSGGQSFRADTAALQKGDCLIIDIGGLTTGFAIATDGAIDYTAAYSLPVGVQRALDSLANMIRRAHRDKLKGMQVLPMDKVREAFRTGVYDAGGKGSLDVRELVANASNEILYEIENTYMNRYGGPANYNSILLAGGGGWQTRALLKPRLDHETLFLSAKTSELMVLGAAEGGYKTLQALHSRGKL